MRKNNYPLISKKRTENRNFLDTLCTTRKPVVAPLTCTAFFLTGSHMAESDRFWKNFTGFAASYFEVDTQPILKFEQIGIEEALPV